MSATAVMATDPNEVTVQIPGGVTFKGWQTVSITRSCETMPNSWSVSASTQFMQSPASMAASRPGQSCLIYIGSDLVITGWIDRRHIHCDAHSHTVTLSGRGITRNLVDCSVDLIKDKDLVNGYVYASSTFDLATRLCKPFNITVRSAVQNLGFPIPGLVVNAGETPYQIIESAARYAGFLVYEDENGNLILDQVGKKSMSSGFKVPGYVEVIDSQVSVDERFSDYLVVWTTINQLSDLGVQSNRRALKHDGTLGEYRPRIIVSEQTTAVFDVGLARANWEMARRIGRGQRVDITCDSWRDEGGKLWTPNWLAPIEAPSVDITNANWIIGTATFRKDASGTHTDLVLMPPDAFNPEPNPLGLVNAELLNLPQSSQSPAPAGAVPAPAGGS